MSKKSSGGELSIPGSPPPTVPGKGVPAKRGRMRRDLPRIPPAADGIQSNHCRNVACSNFGVEPMGELGRHNHDGYRIVSHPEVPGWRRLRCMKCGEYSYLKSNEGIREEIERLTAYLKAPADPSCPNAACRYHGRGINASPSLYQSRGSTKSGSARYRCKACLTSFSVSGSIRRQRKSHENREVFLALVNKMPIKGIARARGLSPKAVYDKIAFIHRQCVAFVADRERDMSRARLGRLYLATDRQDYVINWTDRKDKRNTQLTAVGTSDNRTGYVFGMHLNFDPAPMREDVEARAIVANDFDGRDPAYRKYARFWMEPDLDLAIKTDPGFVPGGKLDILDQVDDGHREIEALPDPEAKERVNRHRQLPVSGMQVHFAYTVHAHFRLLRRMIAGAGKIRFFFDQDDTLRAACISAFKQEIAEGKADAFFVKIDKTLTVDQRRQLVRASKRRFDAVRATMKKLNLSDWRIRILLMEEVLSRLPFKKGGRRDPWVKFPEHTMGEPEKAVCHLTDRSDYGLRHLAIVQSRASLHSIDRFFMQVRRLLSLMERPIATPSNVGRVWRGYSPYRPERIQQLLDIYRVYYNYVAAGKDRKTPAMRIGLAKGRVRIEDILYFGVREPSKPPQWPRDGIVASTLVALP